jgi:titin
MSKILRLMALVLALPCLAQAATYTVTNTADSGTGSLRWAINQANANAGTDTIHFSIGSGAKTIAPASALPTITQTVTIDATTQGGYAGTPLIEINGANAGSGVSGLTVSASNVMIKGLVINRFNLHGILINSGSGTTVTQCYLGTDASGVNAFGNGHTGVYMANTGGHVIGPGNVISGNAVDGVRLDAAGATGTVVKGNKIGTNAAGNSALANGFNGVVLTNGAHDNVIGGTTSAELNVISGNTKDGIGIGSGATGNIVEHNFIGLDSAGNAAIPNKLDGVLLTHAPNNKIGGDAPGTFNIIGSNGNDGIEVTGADAGGNLLQRNVIGSDLFGNLDRRNNSYGIQITDAPNTVIGSGAWGSGGNLISCNGEGLYVSGASASGTLIQGNRFGLNAAGTALLQNERFDIELYGDGGNATIGVPGAGNVIAGSVYGSINLEQTGGNLIQSNYIGTDATGNVASGGVGYVSIYRSAHNNTVGGPNINQRNIISGGGGVSVGTDSLNTGNVIENNWIGVAANGAALGNPGAGVSIYGPATTVRSNVIANNTDLGIYVFSNGALIAGNMIGTNPAGTAAMGNGTGGIRVSYSNGIVIGGTTAADRNIISGNTGDGLIIENGDNETRYVYGNYIGTDVNGTAGLGNSGDGIHVIGGISGSGNDVIGGVGAQGNLISGNGGSGVHIDSAGAHAEVIQGNKIGTQIDGTSALANAGNGVWIGVSAGNNLVGGVTTGSGNDIRSNGQAGVYVATSTGNVIEGNSITGNGGLGIDLGTSGVTANDAGDSDSGANDLQNFPVLSVAYTDGSTLHINGALNSAPNAQYRIEFFVSSACDASGYGEGAAFVTALNATTDANGNATIAAAMPSAIGVGQFITATATSSGASSETSEFSGCKTVVAQPAAPSASNNGPLCQNQTLNLGASTISGASYSWTGPNGFTSTQQNPSIAQATTAASGNYSVVAIVSGAPSQPATTSATINSCSLSIADTSVTEGNSGTVPANFQVTLDHASTQAISVQWATADGTAVAPADYASASGTLTFNANETSKTITVNVAGDTLAEGNETFKVNLSNASAGSISRAQATGTIIDDDTAGTVQFSATSYSVAENAGSATITVTRSDGSASGVTVNYATANGTATAGSDYTATSGTLSFGAGETSKTFNVPITNDTLAEGNETVQLSLSTPGGGATLGSPATATLTIIDDDTAGTLQFSAATYSIAENAGSATITVTRSGGSASGVTVNYATANGTATAGSDYTATSGTLNFGAGETSKTFSVPITNDTFAEGNETVQLSLSTPGGGATLGSPATATLTIIDDDTAGTLQFSAASYSVVENAGNATITVTRTGGAASGISVHYATTDGTATAPSDYTATSGTLNFGAGETSKTFNVPITNDNIAESTESLNLSLDTPTGGATLGTPATATLTIIDDDASNGQFTMSECAAEISELVPQIQLSVERVSGSNGAISVNYATADGTAKAGSDYSATSGTLNWTSGDASPKTITVALINNPAVEPSKQFSVVLSQPGGGAVLGELPATSVTILDNPDYVFREGFEAPGACAESSP